MALPTIRRNGPLVLETHPATAIVTAHPEQITAAQHAPCALSNIDQATRAIMEAGATAVQSPCTAVAVASQIHTAATEAEESIARQKALFVEETWTLSHKAGVKLKDAVNLVAIHADRFPDLIGKGKTGASLLDEGHAWHNYRSWAAKLGKEPRSRKPDTDLWRRLVPRYRGSRPYVRTGNKRFWELLAMIYEQRNEMSLNTAYLYASDMYRKECGVDGMPTFDQVDYYYERHADQKVVMTARYGLEYARNNLAGYIMREVPRVDECWFSDHHIFDAAVRVWSEEKNAWVPVRPWVTAWMDWGSRYFHGIVIRAISPNRDSIERSLKQGVMLNGNVAPEWTYIDNGKDYKSALNKLKRKMLDDEDLRGVTSVAERLGCKTKFALPYNARAKVIERIFGILCGTFSKTWPSYRGRNPVERPETCLEYWDHPEKLPTLEEFTARFMVWLDQYYHQRPGKGKILQGRAPLAVRQASAPIRPALTDMEVYKAFLRDVPNRKRKILEGGMVEALNRFYSSESLYALLRQSRYEYVNVRVDPDDVSVAWIYTLDYKEIGQALQVQARAGLADPLDTKSIEGVREDIAKQKRRLKALKQGSADNRGLARYRKTPIDVDFGLGELSTPAPAAGSVNRVPRQELQPTYATAADVAALDEALREETAANRAILESDLAFDNQ